MWERVGECQATSGLVDAGRCGAGRGGARRGGAGRGWVGRGGAGWGGAWRVVTEQCGMGRVGAEQVVSVGLVTGLGASRRGVLGSDCFMWTIGGVELYVCFTPVRSTTETATIVLLHLFCSCTAHLIVRCTWYVQ